MVDKIATFLEAGCTTPILRFTSPDQRGQLDQFLAEAAPALTKLGARTGAARPVHGLNAMGRAASCGTASREGPGGPAPELARASPGSAGPGRRGRWRARPTRSSSGASFGARSRRGERLTEAQLGRELGLGKTPIREALVRLIHDRLVRNMPRHGYEVTPITLADVEDLFRLRRILEPAAMELAAGRIDPPLRDRLQQLCRAASYSPGDPKSVDAYRQANHEFHVLVARASGSPRLADAIERLEEESDRVFNLGLMFRDRGETVRRVIRRSWRRWWRGTPRVGAPPAVDGIVKAERVIKEALLASPSIRAATLTSPPRLARVRWAAGADDRPGPEPRGLIRDDQAARAC